MHDTKGKVLLNGILLEVALKDEVGAHDDLPLAHIAEGLSDGVMKVGLVTIRSFDLLIPRLVRKQLGWIGEPLLESQLKCRTDVFAEERAKTLICDNSAAMHESNINCLLDGLRLADEREDRLLHIELFNEIGNFLVIYLLAESPVHLA